MHSEKQETFWLHWTYYVCTIPWEEWFPAFSEADSNHQKGQTTDISWKQQGIRWKHKLCSISEVVTKRKYHGQNVSCHTFSSRSTGLEESLFLSVFSCNFEELGFIAQLSRHVQRVYPTGLDRSTPSLLDSTMASMQKYCYLRDSALFSHGSLAQLHIKTGSFAFPLFRIVAGANRNAPFHPFFLVTPLLRYSTWHAYLQWCNKVKK